MDKSISFIHDYIICIIILLIDINFWIIINGKKILCSHFFIARNLFSCNYGCFMIMTYSRVFVLYYIYLVGYSIVSEIESFNNSLSKIISGYSIFSQLILIFFNNI